MTLRRGLAYVALAYIALACVIASPAAAQKSRRRRPQPPPAAAAPAPAPVPAPTLRPVVPQFRSAVHSTSSRSATIGRSTTGQCRASCAQRHVVCLASPDDASGCGPQWTQCLSDCAGLGYSRAQR